jgi:hypothetical protein
MLRAIYFCWLLSAAAAVLTTVPAHGQVIPTGIPTVPSLRETQFPPTQRAILNTLGDRLKKPGKESLVMVGTLDQFTGGKKTSSDAVTAVWQYPGLMRMTYAHRGESSRASARVPRERPVWSNLSCQHRSGRAGLILRNRGDSDHHPNVRDVWADDSNNQHDDARGHDPVYHRWQPAERNIRDVVFVVVFYPGEQQPNAKRNRRGDRMGRQRNRVGNVHDQYEHHRAGIHSHRWQGDRD